MSSSKKSIPPSVVKRLPKYFSYAQTLHTNDTKWISSNELASKLGLTSSTVRQDFSFLNISGISKRGYEVSGLLQMLTKVLGADTVWKVVIVGAGNLGRALALHKEFSKRRFKILGVFDADIEKQGKLVGDFEIMPMRKLPAIVGKHDIGLGIVAVPSKAAQAVADLMIASGIKGILNMSMCHLIVPKWVSVTDSHIVASLQQLSHCVLFPCNK